MKERVLMLMVGLLIGVILATSLPAGAHHKRSLRKLKQRVANLEYTVSKPLGCSSGDTVTWYGGFSTRFGCD